MNQLLHATLHSLNEFSLSLDKYSDKLGEVENSLAQPGVDYYKEFSAYNQETETNGPKNGKIVQLIDSLNIESKQ